MVLYHCPSCGHTYETILTVILRYRQLQPIDPCPKCDARGDASRA